MVSFSFIPCSWENLPQSADCRRRVDHRCVKKCVSPEATRRQWAPKELNGIYQLAALSALRFRMEQATNQKGAIRGIFP